MVKPIELINLIDSICKGIVVNKNFKSIFTISTGIALVFALGTTPARAANDFTVTSTVTSFTPNGPSEAFTLTFAPVANITGELNVRITNSDYSSTWLPKQTCVDPSPPFQCGISMFTVDGISNMDWSFSANSTFLSIKMNGTGITAGQTVVIPFNQGAFTIGSAGAYNIEVNAPTGPGNMGKLAITAGSAPIEEPTDSTTPTPTPAPSTPAPTAVTAPTVGTAAALAALPKSSTRPKVKFGSSSKGLSKSSKKSLKKVATVAKDGYGVRVTGSAGMQPGVSKKAVRALAKKRAMEIRAYLIKQGVPKEDIIIKTKVVPIGKMPLTLVKVETLD